MISSLLSGLKLMLYALLAIVLFRVAGFILVMAIDLFNHL